VVVCLKQSANANDLHMMPLPPIILLLHVSPEGFNFLVAKRSLNVLGAYIHTCYTHFQCLFSL